MSKRRKTGSKSGVFSKQSQMHPSGRRKTPSRFVPGRDRVSGYYGRYSHEVDPKELKFFDGVRAAVNPTATGVITNLSLNLIPQGTEEKERLGRKCTLKSISVRGSILLPSSADVVGSTEDITRIILYQDKQANGATALVADILETGAGITWRSFNNLANSQRFRILATQTISQNATAIGNNAAGTWESGEHSVPWEIYKKCDIPLEFSSTTGAITELKSNNIGLLMLNKGALTNVDYAWRVRFTG